MIIINKIQLKISQKNKDVNTLKTSHRGNSLNTLVKTKLIRCNNIFKKGKNTRKLALVIFVGIKLDEPYGKNNGPIFLKCTKS